MEPQSALPTEERVREALCSVDDPEVGMNIIDLGLVYRIDIAPERVRVELTMTTPACPMGELITDNARKAVAAALPQNVAVDVALVWEPPWTPDMMSESARQTFGWPR
ncbi:MAG TPA: metal-sulfur cluster assembly factor [Burkholderiales bacterium]